MTYSDVMAMPTYERRYYLGMLTKDFERKQEQIEEQKDQQTTSGGKGSRTSKISGNQLKNKINNGDIPLQ